MRDKWKETFSKRPKKSEGFGKVPSYSDLRIVKVDAILHLQLRHIESLGLLRRGHGGVAAHLSRLPLSCFALTATEPRLPPPSLSLTVSGPIPNRTWIPGQERRERSRDEESEKRLKDHKVYDGS